MTDKTIETIEKYVSFLENHYNVRISLRDVSGILMINDKLDKAFAPYIYHNNPFCNYVKKDKKCLLTCHEFHTSVVSNANHEEYIYSKCHLGVEEYAFPVYCGDNIIAMLFVGQFCGDIQSALKMIFDSPFKFGEEAKVKFNQTIKPNCIPIEDLKCEMNVLCELLSAMYERHILGMETKIDEYKNNHIVNTTVKFIKKNYASDITLDILAQNAYCNSAYLSHLFKSKMGVGINSYITGVRIDAAKHILNISNCKVTQVGEMCGFNDANYFTKVFKKYVGISPTKYKQKN